MSSLVDGDVRNSWRYVHSHPRRVVRDGVIQLNNVGLHFRASLQNDETYIRLVEKSVNILRRRVEHSVVVI